LKAALARSVPTSKIISSEQRGSWGGKRLGWTRSDVEISRSRGIVERMREAFRGDGRIKSRRERGRFSCWSVARDSEGQEESNQLAGEDLNNKKRTDMRLKDVESEGTIASKKKRWNRKIR